MAAVRGTSCPTIERCLTQHRARLTLVEKDGAVRSLRIRQRSVVLRNDSPLAVRSWETTRGDS